MTFYYTGNLPRLLGKAAKVEGEGEGGVRWRVLGASASAPSGLIDESTGEAVKCQDLFDLSFDRDDDDDGDEGEGAVLPPSPTVLVLGSEGNGLRTNTARSCTGFVKISGGVHNEGGTGVGNGSCVGVDSLKVSVTGGIMLSNLLRGN